MRRGKVKTWEKSANKMLIGRTEIPTPLGRNRNILDDNIKKYLEE